ncbi:hypothetical protein [Bacillus sp. MUM 13]|uniref:hypothetical protein n=1 Tax=Bacillus sp. MUM 13 TaxID=1678001 RepID=UPI0008F5CEED|nr:hypothetical protein [Bacillus sp. MUM 13]OIK13874.1 hypothetical protein BIV59_04185 [Bacillus sp. MUM 13]
MQKGIAGFYLSVAALLTGSALYALVRLKFSLPMLVYGAIGLTFLLLAYLSCFLCVTGIFREKDRKGRWYSIIGAGISGVLVIMVIYLIILAGQK